MGKLIDRAALWTMAKPWRPPVVFAALTFAGYLTGRVVQAVTG